MYALKVYLESLSFALTNSPIEQSILDAVLMCGNEIFVDVFGFKFNF